MSKTIMSEAGSSSTGFRGIGRRLDGGSSRLLTAPLTDDERYVLDAHAPSAVPKEKAVYTSKWLWHPKGTEGSLKLGKIGLTDILMNMRWGSGAVVDSEIHIIYLPHLPVEMYRGHNINVSLRFEGSGDDSQKMMAGAIFPSPLHTHLIFFPGHSFSVAAGTKFPWSIEFSTTADVSDTYKIADIIVQFKGYNTPLSQYTGKTGVNIISLVPMSEIPTGVTLTRPRGGGDWILGGLHYGIRSPTDINTLMLMQEAGVDIEGLQLAGKLKAAVKVVGSGIGIDSSGTLETEKHNLVRRLVMPLLLK